MMKMKMKTMMFSVPPIQFSKNFFFSHKNASSAQYKVNSSLRKKKTTTFSKTRPPLFAFLLFVREREREERVGRTALNVNAKRQQLTEN